MALRFSANISTLFQDYPFLERFSCAKKFGFEAVEIQWPFDATPQELGTSKGGMSCDLINNYCSEGKLGYASIPENQENFMRDANYVLNYYNVLFFKKLHITSGFKDKNYSVVDHCNTFSSNLKGLVEGDFLENINVVGVIEPICTEVANNYFLNDFEMALEIVKEVNSPYIKLLLDVYHLHKITGDVKKNLEIYYPYAGHIQVSQDPGRTEPFSTGGNIDYQYVFDFLRQKKHTDFIGLEYVPSDTTDKAFQWMKNL